MPTVETNKAQIFYQMRGEGRALVFAHGAGGNAASWWQQVPHFEDRYKVITFDHRTFGRSSCAPEDFSPRFFASDLAAILDQEGIDEIALVCQSMGGRTGLAFALEHPNRLSCLVMGHTTGGIEDERVREIRREHAAARERALGSGQYITASAALAADYPDRNPRGAYLYDQIGAFNVNFDRRRLGQSPDNAPIEPEALTGIAIPVLFITGTKEQLIPPAIIHHVADLVPGATVVEVPDSGHSSYFETPDILNRIVDEFLAAHYAPAATAERAAE